MFRALRVRPAILLAVAPVVLAPSAARASSVMEFPDNGSEQEARGGAWVARASDPLATFYNPAGLAGQPTRLTLQANISTQNTCFTRVKAANDTTPDGTPAGGTYPQVCQNGNFFPDPQLAFTYHLTDRIGLGIAVLGPSAVGNATWPDFINGSTLAPQRYLLVSSNVVLLTPTIGIGWEATDRLRLGASFIFGTAPTIDFISAAAATSDSTATAHAAAPQEDDIRAELKAKDIFLPGFTLGAIWSPVDSLDVAAWFKYMAPISATGDITTQALYYEYAQTNPSNIVYGDTALSNCNNPNPPIPNQCGSGNNASLKVPIPTEFKLGVRYHKVRTDVTYDEHEREPMKQDAFDVEADFTYANDGAFNALQLRFPAAADGSGALPANPGIPGGQIPPNADIPHEFRDVFGVRLGGDYNVLPDRLTVRGGGFFETQAANPLYQNIDFDGAARFGLAIGGQYRIHVGQKSALDFMAGFGHVFFATLSNTNPDSAGVYALAGERCPNSGAPTSTGGCTTAPVQYRTIWPVNLGTITSQINVINVGASYRF